jgi:hypothetical protein
VSIPLSGNTLTVSPSAFGSDISSFSSNPVFLVFFYR